MENSVDLFKYAETYSSVEELYGYIEELLYEYEDDCSLDIIRRELHYNFGLPYFSYNSLLEAIEEILED